MSTHAHYAGEFGAMKMTKKLEKDPAYRAARAEHYAREAQSASEAHRTAITHAARAEHALIVAHAEKRTKSHAAAATKLAPGSEHEQHAHAAYATAAMHHENVTAREASGTHSQTTKISTKRLREELGDAPRQPHTEMPVADAALTKMRAELQRHTTPLESRTTGPTRESTQATMPIPILKIDVLQTHPTAMMANQLTHEMAIHSRSSDHDTHNQAAYLHRQALVAYADMRGIVTKKSDKKILEERIRNHQRHAEIHESESFRLHSDEHLAQIVHEHAAQVGAEGRFNDRKVFTHEIYEKMSVADKAKFGSMHDFKDKLRDLNRGRHVELARADFVAAMDTAQVAKSHVNLENVGHHDFVSSGPSANFVIVDKARGKIK